MNTIGKADLYSGKKRLKSGLDAARAAAGRLVEDGEAAGTAREMMRFHYGLKTRHLDSLIVADAGDGAFCAMLVLKDTPRGMPNVIGAPGTHGTREAAEVAAASLLAAAMVMVLDYKAEMRAGTADNLRRFEIGDFALGVPAEIVALIGKRIPEGANEATRRQLRDSASARIRTLMRGIEGSEEAWAALGDDAQVEIMTEAAKLLCVEVNSLEA
ncbi:hypothetical protein [Defluviimonas salinarum]|uniref:Uncharacterized protein n=1 Tax=Defluviimonas salinarum TaxID=2992147 RepID=A0ABT3J7C5_9RHOB|nr:hypothetical protein [Defluviimonas salinarum]MCW3783589.1 hypothetical protein [Defluviimonas salinarum]